jgi:hypothetical protein
MQDFAGRLVILAGYAIAGFVFWLCGVPAFWAGCLVAFFALVHVIREYIEKHAAVLRAIKEPPEFIAHTAEVKSLLENGTADEFEKKHYGYLLRS